MRYSQDIIDEIKSKSEVTRVISEYVRLEKRGATYVGLCPFHNEKTPSFTVSPQKQMFFCFGCHKGGNVFNFVSMAENISYAEAIRVLAERAGVNLPVGNDEEEIKRAELRQKIIEINTNAARFYFENLKANKSALKYLLDRGLTQKSINSFGLGYSPAEWNKLYTYLVHKGYSKDILMKTGLFSNSKNNEPIDKFRNRIMFPIFDVMGKVIGFGGRVLDKSEPKYLNSPETPVYNKGKQLYALNFAKRNNNSKQIIIVEGYMDVISLHQSGITNVVASLGTALTENQGRLLKKYCEEIIISYDADKAGQNAAIRGLDILNNLGCKVKVIRVPDGKDPDEFIKNNGPERFLKLVDNAMSLVDFKAEYYTKSIDTASIEGRVELLDKLAAVLAKIDNYVEREMYLRKFAKQYEISEQSLLNEIEKKTDSQVIPEKRNIYTNPVSDKAEKDPVEDEKQDHDEKMLLALLCIDNDVFDEVRDIFPVELFTSTVNKEIANEIYKRLQNKIEVTADSIFDIASEEQHGMFAKIINQECNFDDNLRAVKDIIKRIEQNKNIKRQNEIIYKLVDASLTKDEREALNNELKELIRKKK